MNPSEFNEWCNRHCNLIHACQFFFENQKEDGEEVVKSVWRKILWDTSYIHACKATDLIVEDESNRPYGADRTAQKIKQLAEKIRIQEVEEKTGVPLKDQMGNCQLCDNSGAVLVFGFGKYLGRLEKQYGAIVARRMTAVVQCQCQYGMSWAGETPIPKFDRNRMTRATWGKIRARMQESQEKTDALVVEAKEAAWVEQQIAEQGLDEVRVRVQADDVLIDTADTLGVS